MSIPAFYRNGQAAGRWRPRDATRMVERGVAEFRTLAEVAPGPARVGLGATGGMQVLVLRYSPAPSTKAAARAEARRRVGESILRAEAAARGACAKCGEAVGTITRRGVAAGEGSGVMYCSRCVEMTTGAGAVHAPAARREAPARPVTLERVAANLEALHKEREHRGARVVLRTATAWTARVMAARARAARLPCGNLVRVDDVPGPALTLAQRLGEGRRIGARHFLPRLAGWTPPPYGEAESAK